MPEIIYINNKEKEICDQWVSLDEYLENYEKEKTTKVLMDNILIKTKCTQCKKGYYKDFYGNCVGLNIETCSYISIYNSDQNTSQYCSDFCLRLYLYL